MNELTLISSETPIFTTVNFENKEEATIAYNAIMSPEGKISDIIGKPIIVTDYQCELKEFKDAETEEVKQYVRTTIITDEGKGYTTGSKGIYESVRTLTTIFGLPSKENQWHVTVKMSGKKYTFAKLD